MTIKLENMDFWITCMIRPQIGLFQICLLQVYCWSLLCYLQNSTFPIHYILPEPPNKPQSITSSLNAVPEGSSTTLTCNHDNIGTLTFTWSKDGQTISGTSSTLVISSFTSSDAGDYTCVVNETPLSSPQSDPITIIFAGNERLGICYNEATYFI